MERIKSSLYKLLIWFSWKILLGYRRLFLLHWFKVSLVDSSGVDRWELPMIPLMTNLITDFSGTNCILGTFTEKILLNHNLPIVGVISCLEVFFSNHGTPDKMIWHKKFTNEWVFRVTTSGLIQYQIPPHWIQHCLLLLKEIYCPVLILSSLGCYQFNLPMRIFFPLRLINRKAQLNLFAIN